MKEKQFLHGTNSQILEKGTIVLEDENENIVNIIILNLKENKTNLAST